MKFYKRYIKNIIRANNDNSLAIFVGAGISKSAETSTVKLPVWSDLIGELKRDLGEEEETDYLKIAQLYYLAFGEHTYYRKIKDFFPENISPSELHKLIFEINPHIIITTNWDNLLEKSIEENAFIYDIVCSDTDLIKSSLQNKLIKMHGDFKNHNFVFKENDYLGYTFNFPIIENYIKSVISTHTVLFLGYSYNDVNLKQIVKWIQNYSKVQPPMYLVTFKENQTQSQYYADHGITNIVLRDLDESVPSLDQYSKMVYSFLSRIHKEDDESVVESKKETIEYVYRKLIPLDELNGILLEQIQKSLTNCGFIYDDDSRPILEFYDQVLTGDYNGSKRNIYRKFIQILKDIDKTKDVDRKLSKIFEILYKAQVKGIIISNEEAKKRYLLLEDYLDKFQSIDDLQFLNFDFSSIRSGCGRLNDIIDNSFRYYQSEKRPLAFHAIEEAISLSLKQRSYAWLFISMLNRNLLLRMLNLSFNDDRSQYSGIAEYDLKDKYSNLPKDLQTTLEPLYNFIDTSFIYKYAYDTYEDLKKAENSSKIIESGGMSFNSDQYKPSARHRNFVMFVLLNRIMIEELLEYKTINKIFVEISITKQANDDKTILSRFELFASIKYLSNRDLRVLFDEFYNDQSKKRGKLEASVLHKQWLTSTVFNNIVENYLSCGNIFSRSETYLENVLFVLSLLRLEKKDIDLILENVKKIITQKAVTLSLFKGFNLFIAIQYNIYKSDINPSIIIDLIEKIIAKFVCDKFSGHEYHAFTKNEFNNLFLYAREKEALFLNHKLLDQLLFKLEEYPPSEKMDIYQNILLSIYEISSEQIKHKIKEYLSKIEIESVESYKRIIFQLNLFIYGIKDFDPSVIDLITAYLDDLNDKKMFSSALFTIGSQLDFLVQEKDINDLRPVSNTIKNIIDKNKEMNRFGIFR